MPSRTDVNHINNIYNYLDKLIAIQQNIHDHPIGYVKAIDCNLDDEKTGESLYCIIRRQNEALKSSNNYNAQKSSNCSTDLTAHSWADFLFSRIWQGVQIWIEHCISEFFQIELWRIAPRFFIIVHYLLHITR